MTQVELDDWDWEENTIRRETGLIEHTCPHGIGHPNPGSAIWVSEERGEEQSGTNYWTIHGCDGCCNHATFPNLESSLRKAHDIIRWYQIALDRRDREAMPQDLKDRLEKLGIVG